MPNVNEAVCFPISQSLYVWRGFRDRLKENDL